MIVNNNLGYEASKAVKYLVSIKRLASFTVIIG